MTTTGEPDGPERPHFPAPHFPAPNFPAPNFPDDSRSPILHVDMDAFYASVEVRDRPELRGRPVVVGGGSRGVVLSATYEARRFGVRSAMPMGRALRLCPRAVVVNADHARYQTASRAVMAVFRDVTPLVEPLSLDEAFLDTSGARRLLGGSARIAAGIRERVSTELGLTCSVGVAPSMFIAKVASARCKPDGLLVVPADGVTEFLHPLPISALWGVGPRAEAALARLGLRVVADVANTPLDTLRRALGAAAGSHLHALANGFDERTVTPDGAERSIGAEETFPVDTTDVAVVTRELLRLSARVSRRLRERSRVAATIGVKLRYADFTTVTRAKTLPEPTDVTQVVYATARGLVNPLASDGRAVRLVGVRAERLRPTGGAAHQLTLDEPASGWAELDRTVDDAARRFGPGSLRPATLLVLDPRRAPRRNAAGQAGMPAAQSGQDEG